jgi:hypothetical protein
MESKRARELASRALSGGRLTQAEEQWLLAWLEQRPKDRDAFLADEAMDSLLRCLTRLDGTEDQFVRATLCRVAQRDARRPGAEAEESLDGAVESDVDKFHTSIIPSPRSKNGRLIRPRANWRWAAAVCCAALLLMGGIGWLLLAPGRHALEANRPPGPAPGEAPPVLEEGGDNPMLPKSGFAQLVSANGAVWDAPRREGDRLSIGVLQLAQGEAEIRFDKGTIARLTGPASLDLRTVDEVFLHRGKLTARVPAQAAGFTVATPVSRVVDLGTEFDVSVEKSGRTETLVREGRVVLNSQRVGELPGKPIELSAEGLDRAISSVPAVAGPVLPVSTVATGRQSQFVGIISVDGKTMEFDSLEAFREGEEQVLAQLREAPAQFKQKWSIMVDAFANSGLNVTVWTNSLSVGDIDDAGFHSITVTEGGKTISITERGDAGIVAIVLEPVDGGQRRTVVYAADAQELKRKNAEAYRLYDRHFGSLSDVGREGDDEDQEMSWPGIPDDHPGPPQMREFLDNMHRQMQKEMEDAGRTGPPGS